jgi:protein O-mannosyl-transferase
MKKNITKINKVKKEIKSNNTGRFLIDFVNKHFNLVSLVILTLVGIIVYSNTFDCSFHFDDEHSITENPIIKDLSNFTNINYWLNPGRQIAFLSFTLNYHFNKLDVFGYHLINIIIHIITGIFTFFLIKLILNLNNSKNIKFNKYKNWLVLFSALFFIVHPLQTQAVTYIVQRMASMAAMFYICSIYLYAIGRIEHVHKNNLKRAFIFYILAVSSGIMGVWTKENAATFPFAMLLFEFFFIRNKDNKIYKNYIIISLSIFLVLCISYILLNPTIVLSGATSYGFKISSLDYLINQFLVIVRYLQLTVLPINQCADYGNVNFNFPFIQSFLRLDVIGSLIFLIGLIVLALFLYKKNKALSYGICWFILALSIESSIIPIDDPMFEHRMYLPMAGLGLFIICSLFLILNKLKPSCIFTILSALIIVLGLSSYSRNKVWKNDYTLWSDVTIKAPYNARGWYNKGCSLKNLKKDEEEIKYYDEAIRIKPDYHEAWYNKGLTLALSRKYEEAITCFDKAINIKSDKCEAWNNKGINLSNLKRFYEALKCFEEAVKIKPDNYEFWNNEGGALYNLGRYDEAVQCCNKALDLKPEYQEAINNRRVALEKLNQSK